MLLVKSIPTIRFDDSKQACAKASVTFRHEGLVKALPKADNKIQTYIIRCTEKKVCSRMKDKVARLA